MRRLLFFAWLAIWSVLPAYAGSQQDGAAVGSTVTGKVGSKSGISNYFANPLTSSNAPMQTVDGQKSFSAQISCPSSTKFIEVTALPLSDASGDLSVLVTEDTTVSTGAANYTYTVPRVSGVCANGFITCSAGTWNACLYYKWTADTAAKVSAASVAPAELGGCFCINTSCGYNLGVTNYPIVMNALGGGVVGAVQATNPQYAISKANVSSGIATYYGQKAGDCLNPGPYGPGNPSNYYSNPGQISADSSSQVSSQSVDPNSYYSMLQKAQAAKGGATTDRTCQISRTWIVTTKTQSISKAGSGSMCIIYDLSAGLIKQTGVEKYDVRFVATTDPGFPNCPASSPLTAYTFDLNTVSITLPQNAVSPAVLSSGYLNASFSEPANTCTALPNPNGTLGTTSAISTCSNTTYHQGTYSYTATIDYRYDESQELLDDTCTAFATDPNCMLKDEIEYDVSNNGVTSYQNYNPTNLHVLASAKTIATALGSYSKSYDVWKYGRTYTCVTTTSYSDTAAAARNRQIKVSGTTAPATASTWNYTDLKCDQNGQDCVTSSGAFNTPATLDPGSCVKGCKVKAPAQNTQATGAGNTSQFNISTDSSSVYFRQCNNGTCPYDLTAGESVVAGPNGETCWCVNEFSQAATALAVIHDAAQNLICSSMSK